MATRSPTRNALTLLELLVVLMILAIVATVAVNSLQPRIETARFENSKKLLQNVCDAAIGTRRLKQDDGTPLIAGFVADIGRLPKKTDSLPGSLDLTQPLSAKSNLASGYELSELWNPESELATTFPFQFRSGPKTPADYSDIQLPCGWRGPYLQLAMGQNTLLDSWGRAFEITTSGDSQIDTLVWNPIGSYDQPIVCDLKSGKVSVTGTINFDQTVPAKVNVVMLMPDPKLSRTTLSVKADEDTVQTTFSFSEVPVGMRVICVEVNDQRVLTKYLQVPHEGLSLVFDLSD